MAATFARIGLLSVTRSGRRSFAPMIQARALFGWPKVPEYGPDPLEHATGLEKRELLNYNIGNMDPWELAPLKRGPGTREEPNIVPSVLPSRMIACVCSEDALFLSYMIVYEGAPKRCACGYWFKLGPSKAMENVSWYE